MSRQNRANRSFLALRRHTLASPRRTNPTGATSPNETCIRAASRRLSPPRMKNVALRAAAWLLEKTNPLWQPAKENKGVASRRQSIFGRSQSARTERRSVRTPSPNEPTRAGGVGRGGIQNKANRLEQSGDRFARRCRTNPLEQPERGRGGIQNRANVPSKPGNPFTPGRCAGIRLHDCAKRTQSARRYKTTPIRLEQSGIRFARRCRTNPTWRPARGAEWGVPSSTLPPSPPPGELSE